MSELEKQNLISDARGLAKWFSVDITIKIFGQTIFSWHYPPEKSK